MSHLCHARGCPFQVKPELLMCLRHWHMVPRKLQRAVWLHYRAGQCDDKRPSAEWHEAASAAIGYVALAEGQKVTRAEVRALVVHGFETQIIAAYGKRGPRYEAACRRVIAEIKQEIAP